MNIPAIPPHPPGPRPTFPDNPSVGTSQAGTGVLGESNIGVGVLGQSIGPGGMQLIPGSDGVRGEGNIGVHGVSAYASGVLGENTTSGPGVQGNSSGGDGVIGNSSGRDGVLGQGARNGVLGRTASGNDSGVWGDNTGSGYGVAGTSKGGAGVLGLAGGAQPGGGSNNPNGVVGRTASGNDSGVWGDNTGSGYGVVGSSKSGVGVRGEGTPAGHFQGDVEVIGKITAGDITGALVTCLNGLKLIGDLNCTGNLSLKGNITTVGDVILKNQDCAEEFDIQDPEPVDSGTVMVINENGGLRRSQSAYDKKVAGIICGAGEYKPGIVLGRQETSTPRMPVALMGKVYCKVDAELSAVATGDLLTTSFTPGHAMKADDPLKAFGAIIGKALGALSSGRGLIPVLVALQ